MHISYQPLWNTLKERGMRKEDLRLAAGLTTNMIANMGKGLCIFSIVPNVNKCYHKIKQVHLKHFMI